MTTPLLNADQPPPFKGNSKFSKYYDYFVLSHAIFAIGFASCALFYPQIYSLFSKEPIVPNSLTGDSIRLSAPFIYGFGTFAARSLFWEGKIRREVATVFCVFLLLASSICGYCQIDGRWDILFTLNTAVFAFVGLGYGIFLIKYPTAFDRGAKDASE